MFGWISIAFAKLMGFAGLLRPIPPYTPRYQPLDLCVLVLGIVLVVAAGNVSFVSVIWVDLVGILVSTVGIERLGSTLTCSSANSCSLVEIVVSEVGNNCVTMGSECFDPSSN